MHYGTVEKGLRVADRFQALLPMLVFKMRGRFLCVTFPLIRLTMFSVIAPPHSSPSAVRSLLSATSEDTILLADNGRPYSRNDLDFRVWTWSLTYVLSVLCLLSGDVWF